MRAQKDVSIDENYATRVSCCQPSYLGRQQNAKSDSESSVMVKDFFQTYRFFELLSFCDHSLVHICIVLTPYLPIARDLCVQRKILNSFVHKHTITTLAPCNKETVLLVSSLVSFNWYIKAVAHPLKM